MESDSLYADQAMVGPVKAVRSEPGKFSIVKAQQDEAPTPDEKTPCRTWRAPCLWSMLSLLPDQFGRQRIQSVVRRHRANCRYQRGHIPDSNALRKVSTCLNTTFSVSTAETDVQRCGGIRLIFVRHTKPLTLFSPPDIGHCSTSSQHKASIL